MGQRTGRLAEAVDTLGGARTPPDFRGQYRSRIREHHPDRHSAAPPQLRRMHQQQAKRVNEAWDAVLGASPDQMEQAHGLWAAHPQRHKAPGRAASRSAARAAHLAQAARREEQEQRRAQQERRGRNKRAREQPQSPARPAPSSRSAASQSSTGSGHAPRTESTEPAWQPGVDAAYGSAPRTEPAWQPGVDAAYGSAPRTEPTEPAWQSGVDAAYGSAPRDRRPQYGWQPGVSAPYASAPRRVPRGSTGSESYPF